MKLRKKPSWSNLLSILLIVVLIIPQTRKPIQVAFNKMMVKISSPDVVSKVEQQKIAAFDYKLVNLDGIRRDAPIGKGKVTFLSYWATWCPPCIAELPSIEALYTDYGNKVDFVLISQEEPAVIRRFLNKKAINLPTVNPVMNTPEDLYERSIPTNYIIDQFGNIVIKEQGATNWNSDSVRKTLDQLLGT